MIKVFVQTEKFKGGPAVFRSRLITSLNKIFEAIQNYSGIVFIFKGYHNVKKN